MVLFVHTIYWKDFKLNCKCNVIPKCKTRSLQSPWLCPLRVQPKIKFYDFSIWPMVKDIFPSGRFRRTHQPIKNIQIIELLEPTLPCWNTFISVRIMKETKHALCLCLYPILCCPSTLICRYNLVEFCVSFCASTSFIWKVFSGRPFCWGLIQLNEQVNLLQKKDKNHIFLPNFWAWFEDKNRNPYLTGLDSVCGGQSLGNQSKSREIKKLK